MLVESAMTSPVVSIEPKSSVQDAVKVMLAHGISGLPVAGPDGTLLGILTESDFLQRHELGTEHRKPRWLAFLSGPGQSADSYVKTHARLVEEIMSEEVVTVDKNADLLAAVELMQKHRIHRLPVTAKGKLVGILSRADLLRALARTAQGADRAPKGDDAIREAVKAELARQSWSGQDLIRVSVNAGAVTLKGMILDERARLAAKVAAENVPGVTSVVDELIWVEPMSGTVILPAGQYVTPTRPIM